MKKILLIFLIVPFIQGCSTLQVIEERITTRIADAKREYCSLPYIARLAVRSRANLDAETSGMLIIKCPSDAGFEEFRSTYAQQHSTLKDILFDYAKNGVKVPFGDLGKKLRVIVE